MYVNCSLILYIYKYIYIYIILGFHADSSGPLGCVCIFLSEIIEIIEMTNEASAEAMLVWIMPCKEEFGDSQMTLSYVLGVRC